MTLRAGMFGFALLVASIAQAGEPGAPLEKSKQELQALQKELAAQGGGASNAGSLREALPRMQAPIPGAIPTEAPPPSPSDKKLQPDGRENWLVDGMNQFDRNAKSPERAARGGRIELKKAKPDGHEGESSIMKLYGQQEAARDAATAPKPVAEARKDPFQPFLQDWLAGSPVRGKFFDESLRKSTAPPDSKRLGSPLSPGEIAGSPQAAQRADSPNPSSAHPGFAKARRNPYLAGVSLPEYSNAGTGGGHQPPIAAPVVTFGATIPRAAPADAEPVASVPPQERKAPPPALADDKKYFPQLKKF